MSDADSLLIVGRINGLFGVKGWVKVYSYTRPMTNLLQYRPWQLKQDHTWHSIAVQQAAEHGKGLIALIEGCDDRDSAARWLGAEIGVFRHQLPPSNPEEGYYWSDLIGLQVINQAQQILGQVESLIETGANDVLVVQGERERLIPFVFEHVILQVDLEAKLIRVAWDSDF
ncbi:ribosome maturation factor RimM [Thioflexithrix psekupsensis]|uniref:Ribosome maturation factor RimM n=1 Tax=Thioflexithrix psekupsensis TaxID=1570016 RepID=A0A251X419_9GAMM|nr:ribosome maturation factor RimM [Thioflexithrix psekupsensis]OUD12243.1 ribosome maturation factor RimM [Thioflexithrix psekupsensis]